MHAHAKRNKRRHHPYRLVNGEGVLQMCKSQRLLCAVTFTDVMTIWVHHLCWYRTATDETDNLSSYRFPILHWSGPIISYWKGNWATTTRPRRWLKFAIALNRCLAIATNGDGLFFLCGRDPRSSSSFSGAEVPPLPPGESCPAEMARKSLCAITGTSRGELDGGVPQQGLHEVYWGA